jgi:hypothetical protein
MQYRIRARIQPGAGEAQGRAIAFFQAENSDIEISAGVEILGQDREVIYSINGHLKLREDEAVTIVTIVTT